VKPYKDLSEKSGVVAFETGSDFIKVKFKYTTDIYTYNGIRPGKKKVQVMKRLAALGLGLSTYISQKVKDNYYSKE
jgi:hypothetical protein